MTLLQDENRCDAGDLRGGGDDGRISPFQVKWWRLTVEGLGEQGMNPAADYLGLEVQTE